MRTLVYTRIRVHYKIAVVDFDVLNVCTLAGGYPAFGEKVNNCTANKERRNIRILLFHGRRSCDTKSSSVDKQYRDVGCACGFNRQRLPPPARCSRSQNRNRRRRADSTSTERLIDNMNNFHRAHDIKCVTCIRPFKNQEST